MSDEWLRWVGGIASAAILGLIGWFAKHTFSVHKELRETDGKLEDEISEGDRRLHERIDELIKEIQSTVTTLMKEAKQDRHALVDTMDAKMSELHLDNMRFREKIYDKLVEVTGKLSEIGALTRKAQD